MLGVNVLAACLLFLGIELALRVKTPPWLQDRMAFMAVAGTVEAAGSDRDWKCVFVDGRLLKFEPGSGFDVITNEYSHRVRIDGHGGRFVPGAPERGTPVPFFGDSFTFGVGVKEEECFVSILQQQRPEEFLNLSSPGSALNHHTWQLDQRHEELSSPPRYVICFFLGNDFEDMIQAALKESAGDQVQAKGEVADAEEIRRSLLWRLNSAASNSFLKRSYCLQFFKSKLLAIVNSRRLAPLSDRAIQAMNLRATDYVGHVTRTTDAVLTDLAAARDRLGIDILFLLVPDRYQLSGSLRERKARYYNIPAKDLDPLQPNRMLTELLDRHGFRWSDPTEGLSAEPDPEALYYVNDNHLTPAGHAAFARHVKADLHAFLDGP